MISRNCAREASKAAFEEEDATSESDEDEATPAVDDEPERVASIVATALSNSTQRAVKAASFFSAPSKRNQRVSEGERERERERERQR